MDLSTYVGIVRRRWWIIGVLSVLVGLAVYGISSAASPRYAASSHLSVSLAGPPLPNADAGLFTARSYAHLATTPQLLLDAAAAAHVQASVTALQQDVTATSASDSSQITITATASTPQGAKALAEATAEAVVTADAKQQASELAAVNSTIAALVAQIGATPANSPLLGGLEARYASLVQSSANLLSRPANLVSIVDPASTQSCPPVVAECPASLPITDSAFAPAVQVAPHPTHDAALAVLASLVIDVQLVVLFDVLEDRFSPTRRDKEVVKLTGLPVIGHLVTGEDPAEAFRDLRTILMFFRPRAAPQSLAIVGAERGVGRTFVATGLAAAIAELGASVVLVDGDLRRADAAADGGPGLGDLLVARGDAPVEPQSLLVPVAKSPTLARLPAGSPVADPAGLLASALRAVLAPLAGSTIVVDTPAAGEYGDAALIAGQCDVAIVVIDARLSRKRALQRTVDRLRDDGAHPLGVVVNRAPRTRRPRYEPAAPAPKPRAAATRPDATPADVPAGADR